MYTLVLCCQTHHIAGLFQTRQKQIEEMIISVSTLFISWSSPLGPTVWYIDLTAQWPD